VSVLAKAPAGASALDAAAPSDAVSALHAPSAGALDDALARIAGGSIRALSRAVSLVENADPRGLALMERVYATAPHPWVIGFTGVGGAGKSSLVPQAAEHFAERGEQVAIVAVDPSSPITGGAVLGDRIRSVRSQHERIFFRSLASRGGAGGLSTCIADVVRLMSAAGRRVVLVETVGAGQSEVAIRDVAHTTVVVTAPGLGDEVQAMKAGILEIGAVLAVNKADLPGADETANTLQHVMALAPGARHLREGVNEADERHSLRWFPPVVKTSALTGEGVDSLIGWLLAHRRFLERSGGYGRRNLARDRARMNERLRALLLERMMAKARATGLWNSIEQRLQSGEIDPMRAAREIVDAVS
jgi:LAO/AO transport system kinase